MLSVLSQTFSSDIKPNLSASESNDSCTEAKTEIISKAYDLYQSGCAIEAFNLLTLLIDPTSGCIDDTKAFVTYASCCIELDELVTLFDMVFKTFQKLGSHELSLYGYGAYLYALKQYYEAVEFFEHCLKLDPGFGYAHYLLARSHSCNNNSPEALAAYLEAIESFGVTDELHFLSSCEQLVMNGYSLSTKYFKHIEDFEASKSPFVLHEMGALYFRDGNYENACKYLLRALQIISQLDVEPALSNLPLFLEVLINPYWFRLYFNLGHALFELKKPFNALACFQIVLKNGQNTLESRKMIGCCYLALKQYDKALLTFYNISFACPDDKKLELVNESLAKMINRSMVMPEEDLDEVLMCYDMKELKF